MALKFDDDHIQRVAPLIAALVVVPLWVWLAVRTATFLKAITRNSIPFRKRTVWLVKILALIVGAGNTVGVLADLGVPWLLAVVPAGIIIFLSLREKVEEIVPPKPIQAPVLYQSAWRIYWRLHHGYRRSWLWFGAAFVLIILTHFWNGKLPNSIQNALAAICVLALLCSIAFVNLNGWRLFHWPCPRCGCSFRGAWGRPWLPKHCVYCGLPRPERIQHERIG